MFLTQKELKLEDFLKALNFIAPQGTSINYIIAPEPGIDLPENSGFEQKPNDLPEDESITYMRTQPVQKIDQAISPIDYSQWKPLELSKRTPTPNILPEVTDPLEVTSPFVKIINENTITGVDLMLREDYSTKYNFIPKNTIFHCDKNKLQENEDIKFQNVLKDVKNYSEEKVKEFVIQYIFIIQSGNLDKNTGYDAEDMVKCQNVVVYRICKDLKKHIKRYRDKDENVLRKYVNDVWADKIQELYEIFSLYDYEDLKTYLFGKNSFQYN